MLVRFSAVVSGATILVADVAGSANAALDKVQYELQERCVKRAEQIFAKDWPRGSPDNSAGYTQTASYVAHYNAKLNKCFMLQTSFAYQSKQPTIMKHLFDVNSNKEYGMFFGDMPGSKASPRLPMCHLDEKICR